MPAAVADPRLSPPPTEQRLLRFTRSFAPLSRGAPYLMPESGLQANRPDIYCPPPPSAETLDRLEAEVVKAECREKTAQKAEIKARGEWVPPEKTGWVVFKPSRIAGIQYAVGDAFDPTTVEPRKVEQFKRTGLIGHG